MKKFAIHSILAVAIAVSAPSVFAAVEFSVADGDGSCPSGTKMATKEIASNFHNLACRAIGTNTGARLADQFAMNRVPDDQVAKNRNSDGCRIAHTDGTTPLPVTLCYKFPVTASKTDKRCPSGSRLVTVKEAAILNTQACAALGKQGMGRLANGGSISGSGGNCAVTASQSASLHGSLCTPN
jgi:hypothetical protein